MFLLQFRIMDNFIDLSALVSSCPLLRTEHRCCCCGRMQYLYSSFGECGYWMQPSAAVPGRRAGTRGVDNFFNLSYLS